MFYITAVNRPLKMTNICRKRSNKIKLLQKDTICTFTFHICRTIGVIQGCKEQRFLEGVSRESGIPEVPVPVGYNEGGT